MQGRILLFILALTGFAASACGGPLILAHYQSFRIVGKGLRSNLHAGVDFGDTQGAPALAAADGTVAYVGGGLKIDCGKSVMIHHEKYSRYTTYCHLDKPSADVGQRVKRGDRIGLIGTTGNSGGIPHVHLELCTVLCPWGHEDGNLEGTEDPMAISVGCFDPKKVYPEDRLVLTYPVQCGS